MTVADSLDRPGRKGALSPSLNVMKHSFAARAASLPSVAFRLSLRLSLLVLLLLGILPGGLVI